MRRDRKQAKKMMDKKKKIRIFVSLLALAALVCSIWVFTPILKTPAFAKGKTKWQKLLEKNSIDRSIWKKYLPKVTQKEYLKVKKYLKKVLEAARSSSHPNYGYILHENISTTFFWVGEDGSADNHNISNSPSCWDEEWMLHFGGVDDPDHRNGFFPSTFTPNENPFYFALPYNDFDSDGNRKSGIGKYIPWQGAKSWNNNESVCKNQWIKIIKGERTAYAQWQDAGPFGEDDINYVFGKSQPKSKTNDHAGLDVSPAVRDYLNLSDIDKTSWQFVEEKDVPDGPWKEIITTSGINWK